MELISVLESLLTVTSLLLMQDQAATGGPHADGHVYLVRFECV